MDGSATIQFDVPPAAEVVSAASSDAKPYVTGLIDDEGLAKFWVLQVATLASEARATEVVSNLKNQGYKAFYRPFMRGDQTLFRVQIGPNAELERLQRFRPQIDNALGVESEILRYTQ
jgi:cell division septation protein DedD